MAIVVTAWLFLKPYQNLNAPQRVSAAIAIDNKVEMLLGKRSGFTGHEWSIGQHSQFAAGKVSLTVRILPRVAVQTT